MRIALFHNLPSGGAKRAVLEWVRRLASLHSVDVFTFDSADQAFCNLRPFVAHHYESHFVRGRLFESPFGRLNQLQRWRDLDRISRANEQMARRIDEGAYDVVFSNPCQFTSVPMILQFLRTPSVHFLHEPVGRALEPRPRSMDNVAGKIRAWADRLDPLIVLYQRRLDALLSASLERTPRLLANSLFTRACMANAYGIDTPFCRLGVDANTFAPAPSVARESHVLSVGELSPRKGFDFLIESLSRIPELDRPLLRLACNAVIAGERAHIERLAADRLVQLEIRVGLDTPALVREYRSAAFCVYAPFNEPFGLVPLEAMACGSPVVAVRDGGVPESVLHGHTGLLVSRDPGEFAEAVQRLRADAPLRAAFGRNGREHVLTNWTWDHSVAEIAWHLSGVAGQRAAEPDLSAESGALRVHA